MNLLDVLILLFVASNAVKAARYGFTRGGLSLIGFWIGILAGAAATPYAIGLVDEPLTKLLMALAVIVMGGYLFSQLGTAIGFTFRKQLERFKLHDVDAALGAGFSVLVTFISFWLIAAVVSGAPFPELNRLIRNSAIIQGMNRSLPPAPDVLSRIATLINPNGFPQVFIGPEPRPVGPVNPPSSAEIAQAIEAAGNSTVRIEGRGCGGLKFGSGFVASTDLIVTNAHVVAGIDNPNVVDINGTRESTVVHFDPDLDLAILSAGNLAGQPLPLETQTLENGTSGVTLGYPGGGPLEPVPANILEEIRARGRNIYGRDTVTRPVYVLQSDVESGNSGGPVVLPDGRVFGVIFAKSVTYPDMGYAIKAAEVVQPLQQAQGRTQAVSTGPCISD